MRKSFLLSVLLVCVAPMVLMMLLPRIQPAEETPATLPPVKENPGLQISVLVDGTVSVMALEDYIICVVLAEMPASFEEEALKAQAVAVRTFTCKKMDEPKHKQAAVCADPGCCQAFITPQAYRERGGTAASVDKITRAVQATAGEVITYQGKLIEATYFSCSGGSTEDAAAVWGADVPYLQSVTSPGEENATHYTDTVALSTKEFCQKMGLTGAAVSVEKILYTDGGGVQSITISGTTFTGTQVRSRLQLRSTMFSLAVSGDLVTITTRGFGHRVGMSQYGADAMALSGCSYREILCYYYTGVEVVALSG